MTNTIGLFYNKDLLAKAGVTPPTTWAELRTTAKKLTSGSTYGLAFSAPANYEGTWQFLPFMWSNGGDEKNIATPETAQALQLWVDLMGRLGVQVRAELDPGGRQRPVPGGQGGDDGERALAVPGPGRRQEPELRGGEDPGAGRGQADRRAARR